MDPLLKTTMLFLVFTVFPGKLKLGNYVIYFFVINTLKKKHQKIKKMGSPAALPGCLPYSVVADV